MESKQGGGEVSEDCIPGSCKYETYTMRTLANKYLCNGCNRFGIEVRMTCKGDGFCFYADKDSVFKVVSIEVSEESTGIYRRAVLAGGVKVPTLSSISRARTPKTQDGARHFALRTDMTCQKKQRMCPSRSRASRECHSPIQLMKLLGSLELATTAACITTRFEVRSDGPYRERAQGIKAPASPCR